MNPVCSRQEGFDKPVTIDVVPVCGKSFTHRDMSSYSYCLKLIQDGLVKAGIIADDTQRRVLKLTIHSAPSWPRPIPHRLADGL